MRDMKERRIMKKIKNNYTNFILTVIAIALIGILFEGEIIKPAHAASVDQVCVAGHRFVINNKGGIVQFKRHGNQPVLCQN